MVDTRKAGAEPAKSAPDPLAFAVLAGIFFFVVVIKLGDPVILADLIVPPENAASAIYESWPIKWTYWLLGPLIVVGLASTRWRTLKFKWPLLLPAAWLAWQFISATNTINPRLTKLTLAHYSVCVVLFYLAHLSLREARNPWPVWAGLALALCWVMRIGLEQHFGGLEATRKMIAEQHFDSTLPQAYLNRIASSRIFATFSSADALAGCIELILPLSLVFLWELTPKVRRPIRWAFVAILGGCGLACMYWTGSKAGWLVTLLMGIIALLRSTIPKKWRPVIIAGLLLLGAAALGIRYSHGAKKEQTSVATRYAYWKAALQITAKHPILGTGPGTFSAAYKQFGPPTDDFAQLCHNDYLEQACDSGILGAIIYGAMVFGFILWFYRYRIPEKPGFGIYFAVWLGVFGLALHSIVDYHLFIAALSWPMFFLLGFGLKMNN